ncbi:glycosyl hydrolase family 18 protein [Kosakonia oryziphila]|jgi:Predicted glycosyl hydrolase|uniref:Glycosyl hydrolases family 18 n=1 Tax=Kosakonia oryziphila TaxID=1005667 RepID=A0A1C4FSG4_9ENTR|nr:glycosyl hydrolase family 18 protein [Kosakonia oryziphila]SCC58545.1 Glycosyl hydrolases family 18 [Kosakonia oryziphila]
MINDKDTISELSNSIWLPNWRMQKSLDSTLKALQQQCVKNASPFWYEINDAGILIAKPGSDSMKIPDKATRDLLKKNGASVTPTITTTLMPEDFIRLFSDRSEQQRLAERVRQEVMANGYDGIDLDLEYIALTTDVPTAKRVRGVYTELCQRISSELSLVNKLLSITVMARWSDDFDVWRGKLIPAVYDYKALSETASVLRVMAYDQHAPNTPPGPMAGFQWVKNICDWTRRNVCAANRVEIGIPLYGRDWGGEKVKSVLYENVIRLRNKYPQSEVIYSDTEKEETFTYVSAEGDKHTVWYSNNQSVIDRLALIRTYGFRGAAFWAASYESPVLWDVIHATSSADA